MKKKILKGLGGAGLFLFLIAGLAALHQLTIAGTVTKPFTFSPGGTIKSSEINSNYDTLYNEFNGNIDNNNVKASAGIAPSKVDDYSTNATQMQTTTDPGDVGTESLPTSLQGEIERLRFKIKQIVGGAQWYSDTPIVKASIPAAVAYEDEANVFTQNQKISKATPSLQFQVAANAENQGLRFLDSVGTEKGAFVFNETDGEWRLIDTPSAINRVVFKVADGKMTAGIVPSGRLYDNAGTTALFDGSTKMTAGIVPLARLSAADANSGYPQSGTGGETLRIIRGRVNSDGTIALGTGFTISKTGTGAYTINFSTTFSSAPTAVASATNAAHFSNVGLPSTSSVAVATYNSSAAAADAAFNFIIIGPS